MKKIDSNQKSLIKKILLVVWFAVLTAIFIYIFIANIDAITYNSKSISELSQNDFFYDEYASSLNRAIWSNIIAMLIMTVFYSSFLVLIIPKLTKAFKSSKTENGEDMPRE